MGSNLEKRKENERWMGYALRLAKRHEGMTSPNPSVGCVLIKESRVIGIGITGKGGIPHAEVVAIASAIEPVEGSTAYVTLEPCSHVGKTPPCTDAIIKAGVKRVVIGATDPNPRVNGKGRQLLKEAGISVEECSLGEEIRLFYAGFFSCITRKVPLVTWKVATSIDGKIALGGRLRTPLSGKCANDYVHLTRSKYDAIMVGSGTVISDDPMLTCRLSGLEERSPIRIVLDGRLRTPLGSALVRTAQEYKTWIITATGHPPYEIKKYEEKGVRVLTVEEKDPLPVRKVLTLLAQEGVVTLLLEGGATLAAAMIKEGVIYRIGQILTGKIVGDDGVGAVAPLGISEVAKMSCWSRASTRPLGEDVLIVYHPASSRLDKE